jgi:hypothetical protein
MLTQIIRNVLQDNRFAFTHLPDKLQGLVVDSYQHAFFFGSRECKFFIGSYRQLINTQFFAF